MPNFDGGHYFLTALAPIDPMIRAEASGDYRDGAQRLRNLLSTLPTARQSPASESGSLNSPFARNSRTHLARFVVIDDVVYNGRVPSDAIVAQIKGDSPLTPQPVDRLNCGYLLFAADFDAADGSDETLEAYLRGLWDDMGEELGLIYSHCLGFGPDADAGTFAAYVRRCQVETTMPFNDYWVGSPPLSDLSLKPLLAPSLIALIVAVVALLGWLFGAGSAWGWTALIAALLVPALIYGLYRYILRYGAKPFPTAPDSDLPSVLKALYLQQRLVPFVSKLQGASDESLHAAFGQFLESCQPADLSAPTQPRGVIRSQEG